MTRLDKAARLEKRSGLLRQTHTGGVITDTTTGKYTYEGWTFQYNTDGSLTIWSVSQPGGVFGSENTPSITLSQEDVHKLITYSLTGNQDDQQIIEKVRNLSTVTPVTTKS